MSNEELQVKTEDAASKGWLQLGRTIPVILLATFMLDFAARFTSVDNLCHRAAEAAERYHPPGAPFSQRKTLHKDKCSGDLGVQANFPKDALIHTETFNSDALGFRNDPNFNGPWSSIAVGSSFTAGFDLSDNETLPAQLSGFLGVPFYNAGQPWLPASKVYPFYQPDISNITAIIDKVKPESKLVVYEVQEMIEIPWHTKEETDSLSNQAKTMLVGSLCALHMEGLAAWLQGFIDMSPLTMVASESYRNIVNALAIPNPFKGEVARRKFKNGTDVLFSFRELHQFHEQRSTDEPLAFLRSLAAALHDRGLTLLVVLVPSKYNVYRELLQPDWPTYEDYPPYLTRLENGLKESNVLTLNLTGLLRDSASQAYEQNRYIYWLDDLHWNSDGVAISAKKIADFIKEHKLLEQNK